MVYKNILRHNSVNTTTLENVYFTLAGDWEHETDSEEISENVSLGYNSNLQLDPTDRDFKNFNLQKACNVFEIKLDGLVWTFQNEKITNALSNPLLVVGRGAFGTLRL